LGYLNTSLEAMVLAVEFINSVDKPKTRLGRGVERYGLPDENAFADTARYDTRHGPREVGCAGYVLRESDFDMAVIVPVALS
jgi:hypothetical protein